MTTAIAKTTKNGHLKEKVTKEDGTEFSEAERKAGETVKRAVTILAPNFKTVEIRIVGTAPLVMNAFPQKAREKIRKTQEAGGLAKKDRAREAKDFEACYEASMHRGPNGEYGFPASAFRKAMISACRVANYAMTRAKLAVFVEHDFIDVVEGVGLVRVAGEPEMVVHSVRNDSGVVDLRARAMFKEWAAAVRVTFDGDMFSEQDVANLMMRVGMQVGIGEGRHDSKDSAGMGWGTFSVLV